MKADASEETAAVPNQEEYKVFVGGISWQMDDKGLREEFRKFGATDATIMIDRKTMRSRGFGFVTFSDKKGMEEAIEKMHNKELEGRRISVTRAIPQDQTLPGTPAAALGGGRDGRERYRADDRPYDRPRPYDRGYDHRYVDRYAYDRAALYERGYDRYADYDRSAYDRAYGYGPYDDRGYPGYEHYDRAGYAAAYESAYAGYGRGPYDDRYRGLAGPDRIRGYAAARPTPYDRAPRPRDDLRAPR